MYLFLRVAEIRIDLSLSQVLHMKTERYAEEKMCNALAGEVCVCNPLASEINFALFILLLITLIESSW